MTSRKELSEKSKSIGLSEETIEKDYILSWLLKYIGENPSLSNTWIFKGGTCLKKCFFENYRFSEDLDFSVLIDEHLEKNFVLKHVSAMLDSIWQETNIRFNKELLRYTSHEVGNRTSAQVKIYYISLTKGKKRNHPSDHSTIKLDLTSGELIVLKPQLRSIFFSYSDRPQNECKVNCYMFEEIIAEKIRALFERCRPRDLYDVVHFHRNKLLIDNPKLIHDVLVEKCKAKGVVIPDPKEFSTSRAIEELKESWFDMLNHQLPTLPSVEEYIAELPNIFNWLNELSDSKP